MIYIEITALRKYYDEDVTSRPCMILVYAIVNITDHFYSKRN